MSYTVVIDSVTDLNTFNVFRKCIVWVTDEFGVTRPDEILSIIRDHFGVDIDRGHYNADGSRKIHRAIFSSQQEYTWFLLRWS